jgi:hypothetical protein
VYLPDKTKHDVQFSRMRFWDNGGAMKNNEISHPFAAGEAEALASRPNAAEIEL